MSIHHFSDASENGYGQCSYLRLVNQDGKIHCSLLVGKSRVPPKKFVSIPRLELTAAVLSVKMACTLRKELGIKVAKEIFWTDSQVVLAYIRSNSKRFKVFVANRVQQIHENTSINQWAYVPTSDNPADDASRGLDAVKQSPDSRWFNGPSFLWKTEDLWPEFNQDGADIEHDPEVKKDVTVNLLQVSTEVLANGEE